MEKYILLIRKILVLQIIILFLNPAIAFAYIDPGVVGMLFQSVFAFIFGILFLWFTKPYRYLLNLAKKIKSKFSSSDNKNDI